MKPYVSIALSILTAGGIAACAQGGAQTAPSPRASARDTAENGIKPYHEVITAEAKSDSGLFIVHKVKDKWYYEIPMDLFEREMLLVSRRARTAANIGYGGEKNNTLTVR